MTAGRVRVVNDADGIATIELARADVANAFDRPMAMELAQAVEEIRVDVRARALLLTAAGRRFSAGGDLRAVAAAERPADYLQGLVADLTDAVEKLESLELPSVVAVQGAVAGAGLAVMLSGDVVVAAASTRFVFAYAGAGLTPDCGVSRLLPRAIGQQRALELGLTGRILTAAEALDWGLVSRVVEEDALATEARALALQLASGPRFALGQTKRLLRQGWERRPRETSADEEATILAALEQPEAQRALAAFTPS